MVHWQFSVISDIVIQWELYMDHIFFFFSDMFVDSMQGAADTTVHDWLISRDGPLHRENKLLN